MEATLMKYMKYLLEGLAIASSAYYLPQKKTNLTDVLYIGLVGAVTFALLDMFAPSVGEGARLGSGFGIGANHVGFGEGFTNDEPDVDEGFYAHCDKEENFENAGDDEDAGDDDVDANVDADVEDEADLVDVNNDDTAVEDSDDIETDVPDFGAASSNTVPGSQEIKMPSGSEDFTNYSSEPEGFNLY